jgi:hypothetical protein
MTDDKDQRMADAFKRYVTAQEYHNHRPWCHARGHRRLIVDACTCDLRRPDDETARDLGVRSGRELMTW